jgi:methylmalonyl-CoA mutase
MSGSLFSEFAPSSKTIWEKLAQKELKGKLGELPSWTIAAHVSIDPYLTSGELDAEKTADLQQAQKTLPGWLNMPEIVLTDPRKTNAIIKKALENGAQAILLDLGNTELDHCEFPKLLHGLRLSDTPVFFKTDKNAGQLFAEISKHAGYYLKGGLAFDPISHWMLTGRSFSESITSISELLHQTRNMREFRPYMVQTHLYHNNGADPVQELAFAIAAAATYMDLLTDLGITPLLAFNRILFSISVGPQYLTEIAKLRAFRYLLQKISRAYGLPDELCTPFLQARTSLFYHAGSAMHTNMIRSSCEAMSAVIGGCNALTVQAFDDHFGAPDDFSRRIAQNVSSVLCHESALSLVADPAAGSFLLETMSLKIADEAWKMFLKIEEMGGLIKCFENGFVQSALKKSFDQKVQGLNQNQVMVGVNRFTQAENKEIHHSKTNPASADGLLSEHFLSDYYHAASQPEQ